MKFLTHSYISSSWSTIQQYCFKEDTFLGWRSPQPSIKQTTEELVGVTVIKLLFRESLEKQATFEQFDVSRAILESARHQLANVSRHFPTEAKFVNGYQVSYITRPTWMLTFPCVQLISVMSVKTSILYFFQNQYKCKHQQSFRAWDIIYKGNNESAAIKMMKGLDLKGLRAYIFRIIISVADPDPLPLAGSGSTSIPAPDPNLPWFLCPDPNPIKKALIWIRVASKQTKTM